MLSVNSHNAGANSSHLLHIDEIKSNGSHSDIYPDKERDDLDFIFRFHNDNFAAAMCVYKCYK